jgi:hypothetical protein
MYQYTTKGKGKGEVEKDSAAGSIAIWRQKKDKSVGIYSGNYARKRKNEK